MKRRNRMTAGAVLGAGATLGAPAIAQSALRLRIANVWSNQTDGRGGLGEAYKARVEQLSGGDISIELVPYAGLDPETLPRALQTSQVDAVLGAEEDWMDLHLAFGLFTSCPGGLVERELEAWFRAGNGQAIWDEFAGGFGLKSLYIGDTGAEYTWSAAPIVTSDQFTSANVATRGLAVQV